MQETHRWTGEILKPKSTTAIILDQTFQLICAHQHSFFQLRLIKLTHSILMSSSLR